MCLAIPALITEIAPGGEQGRVNLGGVAREISLALLEEAAIGDYVLVHVGYALNRISPEEAARTLELMHESGLLAEALGEMSGEAPDGTSGGEALDAGPRPERRTGSTSAMPFTPEPDPEPIAAAVGGPAA